MYASEDQSPTVDTGAQAKGKGKLVSVKRKQGECYQWKAKGQCTREDACSFRHDENTRTKSRRSSCLAPDRRQEAMGKFFERKVCLSEVGVRLGRDLEDCAKTTSVGNA